MKISKILSMAMAVALVAGKAMGGIINPYQFVMNFSGTAMLQKTDDEDPKGTVETVSINDKFIYGIITNALMNASANSDGTIASTNPPQGSYIVFNPLGYDGMAYGTFYVTNKDGFYLPLSGYDTNDNYYSFMELDSFNEENGYEGFVFGFFGFETYGAPLFGGVAAWNVNNKGSGTENDHVTALFYVHDDPYAYDDAEFPDMWINNYNPLLNDGDGTGQGGGDDTTSERGNNNALEIRGILADNFSFNTNGITGASASLTGSGNLLYANAPWESYGNIIKNATVRFSK